MGAAIGSNNYRNKHVKEKVDKWIKDDEELSLIANDEPQAVLSAIQSHFVTDGHSFREQSLTSVISFFHWKWLFERSLFLQLLIEKYLISKEECWPYLLD